MALQRIYRKAAEGATASFDFVDLASGLGFQTFDATVMKSDSGTSFALVTNQIKSARIETSSGNSGIVNLTFYSSPFNLPRTVKGEAVFSAGYNSAIGGASSGTSLAVSLSKWNGTTRTIIGASQALNYTAVSNIISQALFLLPCSQTIIKQGEQLRLDVDIESRTAGTGHQITIGHDPSDRDGVQVNAASGATTRMRVLVPFRINI